MRATSSGLPSRPSGMAETRSSALGSPIALSSASARSRMPVSMITPGQIAFTLMCSDASSSAKVCVKAITANFEAQLGAVIGLPGLAEPGRDIDDPPALVLAQMRDRRLARMKDAVDVDAQRVVPVLLAHLGQFGDAQDAGAIDQDVELAECLDERIDGAFGRIDIGYVGSRAGGGSLQLADAADRVLGRARIDVDHADVASLLGQAQRDCTADPRPGAGHDSGPAFECGHDAGDPWMICCEIPALSGSLRRCPGRRNAVRAGRATCAPARAGRA